MYSPPSPNEELQDTSITTASHSHSAAHLGSLGAEVPVTASLVAGNKKWALTEFGVDSALSIAQIVAGLGFIPFIGPLVDGLTKVFQAIEKTRVNRDQWKLLQGRCAMVMYIAGDHIKGVLGRENIEGNLSSQVSHEDYPELSKGARMIGETLKKIHERVEYYNQMNGILTFLQFKAISGEIEGYFRELDNCVGLFSLEVGIAQTQWNREFQSVQTKELAALQEVYDCISGVSVRLNGVDTCLGDLNTDIKGIAKQLNAIDRIDEKISEILRVLDEELSKRSDAMQNQDSTTHSSYVGAQRVARTILTVTQMRPPVDRLQGEQCVLDSNAPIKTSITCDVYKARLLDGAKVAKKVFRIGTDEHDKVTRYVSRFNRVTSLWSQFKSDYTLPFYGVGKESFGEEEHFHLYTIAPLMKNSDAVTYLRKHRDNRGMEKGILSIITDAARGLKYLHEHDPPVVHSCLQGSNILITDSGEGVLSGFGSIKALETDYSGNDPIPPPVRTGRSEAHRWLAPELFTADSPRLKTESDVWGWAMTCLELVSGLVPYHTHEQTLTIMLKIRGGPPQRDDYAKFNMYAYRPDEMWELLEQCWRMKPEGRPTMGKVVERLEGIAGPMMPEHGKPSS